MSHLVENLFYHPIYLETQEHDQLRVFEDDQFRIIFSIKSGTAASLPRGLFGSFEKKQDCSQNEFSVFTNNVFEKLKEKGVKKVEIIHPSEIYAGHVHVDWLTEIGFSKSYSDINHHLVSDDFQMHSMEKRKLEKLRKSGLKIEKIRNDRLPEIYTFLTKCRTEKGLELNISLVKLASLFKSFPDRYSIFGAFFGDDLVSAVITVQVNAEVVYYYLPGTLEEFKKESPMVGLIDFMIDHFKSKTKYIDLGVSSEQGKPQEGLISFKERMGGVRGEKRKYAVIV